jgi:NAD-dependent histone deacetylase SIR2
LEELWEGTNPDQRERQEEPPKTRQERLDEEVEKLTKEIDASLKLSGEADLRIRKDLEKTPTQSPEEKSTLTSPTTTTNASDATNLAHVYPHLKPDQPEKPSL